MRNYKGFLMVLSLTLFACKSSKNTISNSSATTKTAQQAKNTNDGVADSGNSSIAFLNMNMFEELEMTESQISRYKSGMIAFQKKKVNMPNGEMLGGIDNERTRQLKKVLSEEQFAKYQIWQRNNE